MAKPSVNLPKSVKDRLLNISRKEGRAFDVLLVRFALERLLYRLSISDHRERFVLKGGMLVTTWIDDDNRVTRERLRLVPDRVSIGTILPPSAASTSCSGDRAMRSPRRAANQARDIGVEKCWCSICSLLRTVCGPQIRVGARELVRPTAATPHGLLYKSATSTILLASSAALVKQTSWLPGIDTNRCAPSRWVCPGCQPPRSCG